MTIAQKVLLIIIIAMLAFAATWQTLTKHNIEDNVKYYKFKSDEYRTIIHKILGFSYESNKDVYNLIAKDMNNIQTKSEDHGKPLKSDETALYKYNILDASIDTNKVEEKDK